MGQNFFERTTTSTNEARICIGDLQVTPTECIHLLQTVFIKKDVINADVLYQDIIRKAENTLPKSAAKGIKDILNPLFTKCQTIFRLLISMDDGRPHAHVDWAAVEASLAVFEQEVNYLFAKYSKTIWVLGSILVPFLQAFLAEKRTKAALAVAFKEKSSKPVLYQMLLNEYNEFGISIPNVVEEANTLTGIEEAVSKEIIEKISVSEHYSQEVKEPKQAYIRDIAYLRTLKEDTLYIQERLGWKKYNLADLNNHQLGDLIAQILPKCFQSQKQHATLQLLAVLNQLYYNVSHAYLSDEDLAAILLALTQSKIELQWQLDVNSVSPKALLIYLAVLCLRGDIVHIEQASRLLDMQNEDGQQQKFLQILNIIYTEYHHPVTDKLGVFHIHKPKEDAKTYYFGSQVLQFSSHSPVNLYLAQSLLELKQQILQPFEAWHAVLSQELKQAELHSYREDLLETVEKMWISNVQNQAPYQNLKQIDHMIRQFQHRVMTKIWQRTEQSLLTDAANKVKPLTRKRMEVLHKHSAEICRNLRVRHRARYTDVLSVLQMPEDLDKCRLEARLYYDQICWTDVERTHWIQSYLKRQMLRLHRLCPTVERVSASMDQLKLFLEYFAEQKRQDKLSLELNAAIQIGMSTYRCIESIVPWAIESGMQNVVTDLSTVTNASARQILARTVLEKLNWVTHTDSVYYRWFVSNAMKNAAGKVYEAANALSVTPDNPEILQNFLTILVEQQHKLAQHWFFPWHWFWRYPDTRKVLTETLQQIRTMISLQQIPAQQLSKSEELGQCAIVLEDLRNEIQRKKIEPTQGIAWNAVMTTLEAIQNSFSGYAMLYELRSYLETQQRKFMLKQHSYFFGTRYLDHTESLLRVLDTALDKMGQNAQRLLTSPHFLQQKARQIQAKHHEFTKVTIQPGYCESQYFDIWITSSAPIADFHQDAKNIWYKRVYHAKDLFKFSHDCTLLPPNNGLTLSMV